MNLPLPAPTSREPKWVLIADTLVDASHYQMFQLKGATLRGSLKERAYTEWDFPDEGSAKKCFDMLTAVLIPPIYMVMSDPTQPITYP